MFLCHQARTFSRTVSRRLCLVQAREASESILIQEFLFGWTAPRIPDPAQTTNHRLGPSLLINDQLAHCRSPAKSVFLLFNSLLLLVELMKPRIFVG